MKQQPSDNYSVAWFKLAEFVSRGEKVRAMGLYRLLAHSLDDQALILQLEGDLLRSFDDANAIERYEHAALAYKASGRYMEAVSIYEHLMVLNPQQPLYRQAAVKLYALLDIPERAAMHQEILDKN
ncbi:MAG: hypothetical protein AB7F19_06865 [Candidatus Babeliales bacterium]